MENFISGGTGQANSEINSKKGMETNFSSLSMSAPITSDKLRQDLSACALPDDDNNLTLSILDELGSSNVSDSSFDLQARFQRLLAESALESSAIDASKDTSRVSPNEFTLGTSTPRFNCSSSSIFGEANKQQNEEFETLFKKYYSEDFVPAENAADRLIADEIAWQKEFALSPPVNKKLELSCFSGIIGDAEISLRSVAGSEKPSKNKVTADEYFNLKTDKMGSLDNILSNKERPNFGQEIESPSINRARVAFVQASKDVPEKLDPADNVPVMPSSNAILPSNAFGDVALSTVHEESDLSINSSEKSRSTLSVTSIEDILSKHLQDTPGTIARSILKPKGKTKSTILSQDNSAFGLSDQMSGHSDNQLDKTLTEMSDWIQVEMSQTQYEVYVGSDIKATYQIRSQSSRWLKCNLSVHRIVYNKALDNKVEKELSSQIILPEVTLVGPGQKTVQKITVSPTLPGNFEVYVNVSAEDAVTQTCKNCIVKFDMISKMPKVDVYVNGSTISEVDFGTLAECCSQLRNLEIRNYSDSNLPLVLSLEEVPSTRHTFSLGKIDDDQSHTNSNEKCLKVSVAFKAPSIQDRKDTEDGFVHFSAYLNVAAAISSGQKTCLLKKLKLKGRVGVTQLLMNFSSPIEISSSGPGIPNSRTLSLRNGGVVPLNLKLMVVDSETWQLESDSVIIVNSPSLKILPGKEASISLVFTPTWVFEERITRKLVIHVAPDGNLFQVDIHASVTGGERGQGKERLSCQSSGSSQCTGTGSVSASSSTSITGMPVQTTHKQLVWNTVPVGRSEMQSCRLRNDWPSTVKVLLSLVDSSHGFWLLNENGEHVLERKMRLHARECVPVNVIFSPSKIGVAYGKIVIREAKRVETAEKFAIPLTGFCGTFNLSIRNVPKDKSGNMWINFGPLDNNLHAQFTVFNKGNLESFVYVKYIPKGVGALLQGVKVSITPSKTVINPGSSEIIKVLVALQNDMSFISKDARDVLELGNLYVTYGDEPTRQRIRRIKERQQGNSTANKVLDLEEICSTFPSETLIHELNVLNDPENALRFLCRTFQQHEIALTVECLDDRSIAMQTCVGNGNLGNQSLVFKSMLPDSTFSASIQETSGVGGSSWSITPSNLTLLLPRFASGCITIGSTHKDDQMFEICSCEDFLSVEPSSGIIPGMGEVVVVVTCNVTVFPPMSSIKSSLKVYLENDMKIVFVHIKPAQTKVAKN